jgi:hypothetical protein
MKRKYCYIILCLFIIIGCRKSTVSDISNRLSVPLDEDEIMSVSADSLYSSVTYIPLETTDESLFYDIDKLLIHDDVYYLLDRKQDVILTFDGKGKYSGKLSQKGNGPGEYLSLEDFFIDDSLLYALSSDSRKIIIYDLNFNFVKSFNIDTYATNIDFLGDNIFVFTNFGSADHKNIYVVDKTNGKIKNRMVDFLEKQEGVSYASLPFAKWNDSLYIVFPYDYSIYSLTADRCENYCSFDFGKNNMFPESFLSFSDDERDDYVKRKYASFYERPVDGMDNLHISEQFIFFTVVHHVSEYKVFIDKKSRQFTVGYVTSTEKYPFTIKFLSIYKDKMIYCVSPELIHDIMERRKDLKLEIDYDFFRRLDIADNPVLCLHTLKSQ